MSQILLMAGNFFILIIALMGVQRCYFKASWKWFWLMLICVLLSATCISIVVYQWVTPPEHDTPVYVRSPTTPL